MIGRPLLLVLIVCLGLGMCNCENREGLPVEYVLPDGYTGYFWVIVDHKGGKEVKSQNNKVILRRTIVKCCG